MSAAPTRSGLNQKQGRKQKQEQTDQFGQDLIPAEALTPGFWLTLALAPAPGSPLASQGADVTPVLLGVKRLEGRDRDSHCRPEAVSSGILLGGNKLITSCC